MEIKKENLTENFNKNIKELKEIKKKIEKIEKQENEQKENYKNKIDLFLNKNIENNDFIQQEASIRYEQKKTEAKKQVLQIQEKIILNNLYNLINYSFKKIIYNDIFYKYTSKNIGEKTKEKIQNEIKDYYKNNYNVDVYFYFNKNYNYNGFLRDIDFKIYLIDTNKLYNNRIVEYSTYLYMDGVTPYHVADLLNVKHNQENAHFIYNYDENFNYTIIENIEAEAKKIYTTCKKLNEKTEKLLQDFENIKKENNELLKNKLCDFKGLYINTYFNRR